MDRMRKVDLRTVTFDVPPQEVLTRDSVTVAVDAVVYYRIYNPVVAITNVEDADRSTRLLAATTLRNVLGTKNLSEILSERDTISGMMQTMLDEATDPWGVKVERVEVKDVRLPVQLQRAMAAEAEAAREARAKWILFENMHIKTNNKEKKKKEGGDLHIFNQIRIVFLCYFICETNQFESLSLIRIIIIIFIVIILIYHIVFFIFILQ
ncbi:unnamed protein product [Schistosoma rodhaini]|nr:unnamed protein product [Schistosoma rodhaini]